MKVKKERVMATDCLDKVIIVDFYSDMTLAKNRYASLNNLVSISQEILSSPLSGFLFLFHLYAHFHFHNYSLRRNACWKVFVVWTVQQHWLRHTL